MKRLDDWQPRLIEYIDRVSQMPFRPGRNDCIIFSAGAVEAMTGKNPAAEHLGTYRSLSEGDRLLEGLGFKSHVDAVASMFDEIPPLLASPGDLAVVECDLGLSVGIVQGPYIYVVTKEGIGPRLLTDAKRAFRV